MAEYIDRGLVINIINKVGFWEEEDREVAINCVKYAKAADVAPVRNAEWIGVWYDGYVDGSPVYEEFECSNCGCEHHADGEPTWCFCPDCGAKMDL